MLFYCAEKGECLLDTKKELELLKQLPTQKRLEILEEKVADLENLIEKYNEIVKLVNADINKIRT